MKTYSTISDYELLQLYKQGNNDALGKLLEKNEKSIKTFLVRTSENRAIVQDLWQETAYKAICGIQKNLFDSEKNFYSWLQTIARNALMDFHVRKKKTPLSFSQEYSFSDDLRCVNGNIIIFQREIAKHMQSATRHLNRKQQAIIKLLLEGETLQSASEVLCIPLGTVRSTVFLAKKTLKEKIKYLL